MTLDLSIPCGFTLEGLFFKLLLSLVSNAHARRGVHCWVSDKAARELSVEGRAAIVEYLSVIAVNLQYLRTISYDSHRKMNEVL